MTWPVLPSATMSLDDLLAQVCDLGYTLRLSGPLLDRPPRHRWEATVTRRLCDDPLTSAVGHYSAADPSLALTNALHLCATDFETSIWTPQIPTCAPDEFDLTRLSNLLTVPTMALSPPKFKLKRA